MQGVISFLLMLMGISSIYLFFNIDTAKGLILFVVTIILIDFFYKVGLLDDEKRKKI